MLDMFSIFLKFFLILSYDSPLQLNDGLGIVDDGPDGVARLLLTCNEEGTAWLDAGVPITQVECASSSA